MGILTYNDNKLRSQEVMTAAALSVVPGLGQIYNGEARKGILFFCAGSMSLAVLVLICGKNLLLQGVHYIGSGFHVRLNPGVIDCLRNVDLRSPQMLLISILLAAFTLFCLKDAVQARRKLKQKAIYSNEALAISEAASGSYILHALMFTSMFLLVLFLFVPPEVKNQFTEITFEPEQPETRKPVVTVNRSRHNSENGGKARPKPVIDTPRAAQTPAARSAPKQPQKQSKPAEEKAEKTPTVEEKKTEQKSEEKKSVEKEAKVNAPKVPVPHFDAPKPPKFSAVAPAPSLDTPRATALTPTPPILQPTSTTGARSVNAPQPLLAMAPPSVFGVTPAPTASASIGKNSLAPLPAPASAHKSALSGGGPATPAIQQDAGQKSAPSAPQPLPSSDGPSHLKSGKDPGAPKPQGAPSGATGHNTPASIGGPVILGPRDGLKRGGDGSPDKGDERKPTGRDAAKLPDYGEYMQDLQRRIKRSWFPPKAPESKKVIVVFTIHDDGEISNVKLFRSSGDSVSDNAAIKAVENAAPFKHLPPNSESTIDVQFTFDYNLYQGRSSSGGVRY